MKENVQEIKFIQEYFLSLLSSETAKNIFSEQGYFSTQDLLEQNIQFSQEIYNYCEEFSPLPFHSTLDIRSRLQFSIKDYVLDINDIFHTHLYLSQWATLKKTSIPSELFPNFSYFIDEIFIDNTLLRYWDKAFDLDGNINDSASPELSRIRNLKKNVRQQIEKILHKYIKKNEDLAEQRIAFREDRYVIPLKSVAKNRHQGIVHGFSSSGMVTYLEPQEIVSLNNELLSVDDLEHQEILRLLKEWSHKIASNLDDILLIIERSALLEIYFTKYHFAKKIKGNYATINSNNEIILKKVYNPFLILSKKYSDITPISIELESHFIGMIISGPNAGGKSASLKTLALCADMFLKGLPIPAQEASLPIFSDLLIEIGDAQNLSNDLSTFSGHIYNIQNILQNSSTNSLIIIDEIAHATDPVEGEALACAIIDELIKKSSFFAITTHYKQVKTKSFEHTQIKSYSAGFDTKQMKALYTLYPNTIGESYALNIAEKMGLSTSIISQAEIYLQTRQDKTEAILSNIEQYEKNLRQKELDLEVQFKQQNQAVQHLEHEKELLQQEINTLKDQGLAKADKELHYCLKELSHLQKTMKSNPKQSSQKLNQIQNIINKKKEEKTNLLRAQKTLINIGDTVYIASLDKDGIVEGIHKSHILIRIGIIKHSVKKSDIFESTNSPKQHSIKTQKHYHTDIKNELDLHGYTVEDALPLVSKYLDRALSAGLPSFTIMHGKGTGALQKAIKEYLSNQPEVHKFHFADPKNGGAGKTIVYF